MTVPIYMNPLNLWDVFINEIAGTFPIFLALAFFMIAIACAKMKIPDRATFMIFIIFSLLMSPFFNTLLILTMLAVSFSFSYAIGKFIGRI